MKLHSPEFHTSESSTIPMNILLNVTVYALSPFLGGMGLWKRCWVLFGETFREDCHLAAFEGWTKL